MSARTASACHRVGNIVIFQVQKNRQTCFNKRLYAVRTMGVEEFQPQFQPANSVSHLLRQSAGMGEIGCIERDKCWIGRPDWIHASGLPPFNRSRARSLACGCGKTREETLPAERRFAPGACDRTRAVLKAITLRIVSALFHVPDLVVCLDTTPPNLRERW